MPTPIALPCSTMMQQRAKAQLTHALLVASVAIACAQPPAHGIKLWLQSCPCTDLELSNFLYQNCALFRCNHDTRRMEGWDPREPGTNEQGPYESTRKQLFECFGLDMCTCSSDSTKSFDSKFQVVLPSLQGAPTNLNLNLIRTALTVCSKMSAF
jgi:hypothetical protein